MLTGRYRYRVEEIEYGRLWWRGTYQLVVLQLEETYDYDENEDDPFLWPRIRTKTYWRDATPEDVMVNTANDPADLQHREVRVHHDEGTV